MSECWVVTVEVFWDDGLWDGGLLPRDEFEVSFVESILEIGWEVCVGQGNNEIDCLTRVYVFPPFSFILVGDTKAGYILDPYFVENQHYEFPSVKREAISPAVVG